jgi:hypothetical protein
MASAVLAAVEHRLPAPRGTAPASGEGRYLRPWEDGAAVAVPVAERPPLRPLTSRRGAGYVEGDA